MGNHPAPWMIPEATTTQAGACSYRSLTPNRHSAWAAYCGLANIFALCQKYRSGSLFSSFRWPRSPPGQARRVELHMVG
jgi:hypothetical protein